MRKLIVLTILIVLIVLTGCSEFEELLPDEEKQIIEKEVIKEVIKEKIVYKNITIPCNITKPKIPALYICSTNIL